MEPHDSRNCHENGPRGWKAGDWPEKREGVYKMCGNNTKRYEKGLILHVSLPAETVEPWWHHWDRNWDRMAKLPLWTWDSCLPASFEMTALPCLLLDSEGDKRQKTAW